MKHSVKREPAHGRLCRLLKDLRSLRDQRIVRDLHEGVVLEERLGLTFRLNDALISRFVA